VRRRNVVFAYLCTSCASYFYYYY
ncbi:hypothetical protein D043_4043B, partial [Vibrio parahaemolyticus EKP-021]